MAIDGTYGQFRRSRPGRPGVRPGRPGRVVSRTARFARKSPFQRAFGTWTSHDLRSEATTCGEHAFSLRSPLLNMFLRSKGAQAVGPEASPIRVEFEFFTGSSSSAGKRLVCTTDRFCCLSAHLQPPSAVFFQMLRKKLLFSHVYGKLWSFLKITVVWFQSHGVSLPNLHTSTQTSP